MQITKSDRFRCIRDIEYESRVLFVSGNIYTSDFDGCLTDEHGDRIHNWQYTFENRFIKIENEEKAPHYNQGPTEVIDQMIKLFGSEAVKTFCTINAFKYRMRAGYKGEAQEDIKKAIYYETKYKEL